VDYVIRESGKVSEIALSGQLTFEDHEKFRGMIDTLRGQPGRAITVDLGGLDFIDSAGLGLLLLLHEAVGASDSRCALRTPQGQVRRLLAVARFETLVPILD
jgi:anti-anti-sigma factor